MNMQDEGSIRKAVERLRSDNAMEQSLATNELIAIGAPAVPSLLDLVREEGDIRVRAMYVLSRIADPETSIVFEEALRDPNERTRAHAAVGLANIGHADALSACIRALNDSPDQLHGDMTPAVYALGEMGLKAIPPLLDIMEGDDEISRLRAQRALEQIIARRHGFRAGQGFPTPEAEDEMRELWESNGAYNYDDDPGARGKSVALWRGWIERTKE